MYAAVSPSAGFRRGGWLALLLLSKTAVGPLRGQATVRIAPALMLLVLVLRTPAPVGGQQLLGTDCELESYRMLQSQELAMGQRVTHVGRPVLVCPDGSRIRADTATVYTVTNLSTFQGNFRYDSPRWRLDADRATYMERDRRLTATGNAILRDHEDGSVIRGDTLVHVGAEDRADELLTVSGRRPSALLPPRTVPPGSVEPGAEPPDAPAPYEVEANRLRFEGERLFRAFGSVNVSRGGLQAASDSLRYDREEGTITLGGNAHLEEEEYELSAATLELFLPGDRLREVRALEEGVLVTTDLLLTAPTEIRILLEEERMERIVAVRRAPEAEAEEEPESAEPDLPRAEATTQDFFLTGDSIDALAPGESLESVTAVGSARGETRGRVLPGRVEEEYPELARKDWIEGEVIVATFEPVPDTPFAAIDDSPASEPVAASGSAAVRDRGYRLQDLVARGSARSLYRIELEEDREAGDPEEPADEEPEPADEEEAADEEEELAEVPERRWAISYLLADEIRIVMQDGEVERLEADGNVRGVHLEPRGRTANSARPGGGGEGSEGEEESGW